MSEDSGLTVAQLLPDRFEHIGEAVQRELHADANGRRTGIPAFVWKGLDAPVSAAIHGALDRDVFELLAEGWRSSRELRELAAKSKGAPATHVAWTLGTHDLTVRVHPVLQVSVPGYQFPPLRFTLELGANVGVAQLSMLAGRITAASAVECTLVARLKYGDVKLHEPLKSRSFRPVGRHAFAAPGLEMPLAEPAPQ